MRKPNKQYKGIVDWKRNNKIALRNFSENVDFHDVVKLLLVRILRRLNPDSKKIPIYTEFDPERDDDFPDIWMRDKHGDIYVWELQDKITKQWEKQLREKYHDVNLIILPLKSLPKNIKSLITKLNQIAQNPMEYM